MTESVTITTIKVAEQGNLGLGNWVWMCVGIMLIAAIAVVLGLFIDGDEFSGVAAIVGAVAFFAWLFLVGAQDGRSIDDLVDRQEAALEEQLNYSHIQVTDDGDFVAADSGGMFVSGRLLVGDDDTTYLVVLDDPE